MLINFCRSCVNPSVNCSTVSNDGYEVTNLISDSNKGFLAYSAIKPPIHIDFTFVCAIQLIRVLIWSSVGAQKSSGFELSVKSHDNSSLEYRKVSSGFLSHEHSGILFYRRDISQGGYRAPKNFLDRYIQISQGGVDNVRNLRISILKTANSVPAIGRVEIWGRVSTFCGKDIQAYVHGLWQNGNVQQPRVEVKKVLSDSGSTKDNHGASTKELLDVPECFMDPITWSIMIQPIILPGGAIIDQSTLEKHAQTEATWGRGLSDPFTGIPINETRKPIVASALKARIDKFLVQHKNSPEIKSMPRLSGYKQTPSFLRNRSVDLSRLVPETSIVNRTTNLESKKSYSGKLVDQTLVQSNKLPEHSGHMILQPESKVHRLPIIPTRPKRAINKTNFRNPNPKKIAGSTIVKAVDNIDKEKFGDLVKNNLDASVETLLSNFQQFDKKEDDRTNTRVCIKDCSCVSKIFYKLPCDHVLCREVLMSIKNSSCVICGVHYTTRDMERIHRHL